MAGISGRWCKINTLFPTTYQRVSDAAGRYAGTLRNFNLDVRLYLVTSALFGFTIFGGIYFTLLNLYLLRLGYDPQFAGLINGVGQVIFGLCALPAGAMGRRWGSRRMLIIGFGVVAVGYALLPLAEFVPSIQTGWLVVMQAVGQIGVSIYFVNGAPFVMTVTRPTERNHAFAMSGALLPLTGFAGSLVGGLLPGFFAGLSGASAANPAPYRYSLLLAAGLMALAVVAMLFTRSPNAAPPAATETKEKVPAPVGIFVWLFLVVLLRVIGEGDVRTFFNIYLDDFLQVPVAQIGLLLAVGQLLAVPAAMVMPIFAKRWGIKATYLIGSWGMALSFLPLALVPHWAAAGAGFMSMITLLSIARPAVVAYQMDISPPGWRTIMAGATSTAVGLGWGIASLSGGYIATRYGYSALFLSAAAVTAAASLVFWLVRPPVREQPDSF